MAVKCVLELLAVPGIMSEKTGVKGVNGEWWVEGVE